MIGRVRQEVLQVAEARGQEDIMKCTRNPKAALGTTLSVLELCDVITDMREQKWVRSCDAVTEVRPDRLKVAATAGLRLHAP